ncbi:MAG TPA: RodZ domain-containing protein, partial [Acidobacteriota bacterium]|nr:RodZ domain-containing protein [Acidobacteriota bacterium]
GAFFIKGIIRTYAHAIGLDADEVLGRYKAAGLLPAAGSEIGRIVVPRPAEVIAPRIEPMPPAAARKAPAEPVVPPEPAPAPVRKAETSLLFEEAPGSAEPSPSRKRLLAWTWRGLAMIVIGCAVFFVVRSIRKPRPPQSQPEAVVTQTVLPPAQTTVPGSKPAVEPELKPEAPAVAEEVPKSIAIEITFHANTWIQVYTDGTLRIDGIFPAGATARAQADATLLIHTGNAGGFTFLLNGKPAKPLGRSGEVLTDIKITSENLKDFLEPPSSGPPAG